MSARHALRKSSLSLTAVLACALAVGALVQGTTAVAKEAPASSRPSAADCAARAERAAMNSTGVTGGAVRGGVGGAAFGAIVNGSKGAKRGAVAGAVVGGAVGGARREDVYKRAYDDCMRGH